MERLTKRVNVDGLCEIADVDEQDLDDAIERLANYEDTGYTPKEIADLKAENNEYERLLAITRNDGRITIEKMHEFLDKYEITYEWGWRDAMDKLIAGLRAENEQLKADCATMREAMEEFCARTEKGEIRSVRTYTKFMEILHATIQYKALNQHK